VSFIRAVEGGADTLDELVSGQQAGGLDHPPLAVDPLGLDGVQPGTLDRQVVGHDPHPMAGQLDLAVVAPDPVPDLATDMPGRIVPDQQQGLLPRTSNWAQQPARYCVVSVLIGRPSTKRTQLASCQPPAG